ncbi:hypothetical protein [Pasteurella multocida]|uniref:hypothetical protein n=1 Tax=Pasteurella multocida TaxID=747 RepID=UPI001F0F8E6C|nr:hypothetical protein [Pasteurella multocida]
MGIDEFFYGGCMRLGSCSRIKRLIFGCVILFSNFSFALEYEAEQVVRDKINSISRGASSIGYASENKAERIVRDLLSSAYNRTYNLPAVIPDSQLSTMQQVHKANVLRSIAKKAIRVSGVLYQKHPIAGLAITLGAGYLADDLIDKAFQKFTSASKDESGAFYVVVSDPQTGEQTKIYLDEEPSLLNPVYISLGDRKLVTYDDSFGQCNSSSYDETLHCYAEKRLQRELERLSLSGVTISEGRIVGYEPHPIYSDGKFVKYSYKRCFKSSDECRDEVDLFTARAVRRETMSKGKPEVVPLTSVVDENQVLLSDDTQIANFAKNVVSLGSQDFTSEERKIITSINPKDVRQHYRDPSLKAKDLAEFKYSENMFTGHNPDGSVVGTSNNTPDNNQLEQNPNNRSVLEIDFSAPDINLPDLEVPTAESIISPFKKLLPDLQNFELNKRTAQCPVWTFNIEYLRFHYELREHCDLIEPHKEILKLLFGIIWAFIALRYVLSA